MLLLRSTLLALLPLYIWASMADQVVFEPVLLPDDSFSRPGQQPSLYDLLTLQTRASIFHSYLREIADIYERISGDLHGACANSTLLVPTNKAVMSLPRKPYVNVFCPTKRMSERLTPSMHQTSRDP
jgi:hypothetical protein